MYNVGIFPLILHSVTCHLPFPSTMIASQSNHSQVATAYSSQPLLRHAFETRSFFCFTELRDGACLGTRRCMQVWAWSPALTNTHTHTHTYLPSCWHTKCWYFGRYFVDAPDLISRLELFVLPRNSRPAGMFFTRSEFAARFNPRLADRD